MRAIPLDSRAMPEAAAWMTPDYFKHFLPFEELEPIGTAVMLGAFGGVLCGGLLGGFAVAVQALGDWLARKSGGGS